MKRNKHNICLIITDGDLKSKSWEVPVSDLEESGARNASVTVRAWQEAARGGRAPKLTPAMGPWGIIPGKILNHR